MDLVVYLERFSPVTAGRVRCHAVITEMSRVCASLGAQEAQPLEEESMRKAFKVATVFTGTAACAAAFAPAAGAATTAGTQQVEPATSHRNCVIGPRTTSMVFWWLSTANHGPTCVGGANNRGLRTTLGVDYSKFCGGNNYGYVYGPSFASLQSNGTVITGRFHFHPGTGTAALGGALVDSVLITNWSGTDTCAT
jgi:hypothetical protein